MRGPFFGLMLSFTITGFSQSTVEWPCYGNDAGGSRYAALDQLNDSTVKQMTVAWTFDTHELETYTGTEALSKAAFEATPIMQAGRLYFSTASDRVFALDAFSGQQIWVYDPKVNLYDDFSEITSRGVSAWPAPDMRKGLSPPVIIFLGTIDGRLIAVRAADGKPVKEFGNDGSVDLTEGYGKNISVTSPPAVVGDLVVVGSSLPDNVKYNESGGAVRAYDVHTGKLQWTWNPVPKDPKDPAFDTWKGDNAHKTGAANAWSMLSVDAANKLVFVPASSPSPDYYGGLRLGQNLYGNCIVALHASTGKPAWYFQVVHHDLWDYDIAAQPMLIDIKKDGKTIPAVVIGTKMGHVFVLNRTTGKPIFPIEERSVPASQVSGESAWPTQPFPVIPAPLGLQRITVADAWGVNEKDSLLAIERIKTYTNEGIFTPPSLQGSLITPGNVGGIHWGGMCYDKTQQLLVTNINRLAAIIRLVPRGEKDASNSNAEELLRVETGSQAGTPFLVKRNYLFNVDQGEFKMQGRPPWGTLLAIDLSTGDKKWETPLGFMMDPRKYPDAKQWGSINLGGAITTGGNLTMVAASLDGYFRAFNTRTGALLWEYALPAGGQATPMTYSIKGKQFIVIAAGGHGKLGTKQGNSLMAFALPNPQ